jgi:hypothetical protein
MGPLDLVPDSIRLKSLSMASKFILQSATHVKGTKIHTHTHTHELAIDQYFLIESCTFVH